MIMKFLKQVFNSDDWVVLYSIKEKKYLVQTLTYFRKVNFCSYRDKVQLNDYLLLDIYSSEENAKSRAEFYEKWDGRLWLPKMNQTQTV